MISFRFRLTAVIVVMCIVLLWATREHLVGDEVKMKVVVLGDSLTAGYGLSPSDAFPAKLEKTLKVRGLSIRVFNAGTSGDTAEMGLARLSRSVDERTDAVVLELGANDMLRGFDANVTRAALKTILEQLKARKIAVLLCGVRTQPERGEDYQRTFDAMFSSLASKYDVLFYPAFDRAFVDNPRLKLADGLHPTAAGVEAVVVDILPKIDELIERARRRKQKKGEVG